MSFRKDQLSFGLIIVILIALYLIVVGILQRCGVDVEIGF